MITLPIENFLDSTSAFVNERPYDVDYKDVAKASSRATDWWVDTHQNMIEHLSAGTQMLIYSRPDGAACPRAYLEWEERFLQALGDEPDPTEPKVDADLEEWCDLEEMYG